LREELRLRERMPAGLLPADDHAALLPDGAHVSASMFVPEAPVLQQVLRSPRLLCSGCQVLRGAQVLPGSGPEVLPGSGLLCSGCQVLRSSEVLPGPGLLRSGCQVLPGSGCQVLRSSEVLSGSGLLRSGCQVL
jgi:hypothetical protein